jgi:hypothetical protein
VLDLAALHGAFSDGLRSHFGKLPIAGIPRISKLNNSNYDRQLRFNIIDPGGNWVRFIQKGEQPALPEPQKEELTKLSRVVQAADLLIEAEGDFEKVAQMLDKALAQDDPASPARLVQALVLRALVAVSLEDKSLARTLLTEVRQIQLSDDEKAGLIAEFQRADDLEKMLQ